MVIVSAKCNAYHEFIDAMIYFVCKAIYLLNYNYNQFLILFCLQVNGTYISPLQMCLWILLCPCHKQLTTYCEQQSLVTKINISSEHLHSANIKGHSCIRTLLPGIMILGKDCSKCYLMGLCTLDAVYHPSPSPNYFKSLPGIDTCILLCYNFGLLHLAQH